MIGCLAVYCFVTFGCIILWSGYRLIFGSKNFDSLTFFYFFSLFFFGIAPLVQYVQGLQIAPMYDDELAEADYLRLNIVIVGVFAVFEIVYRLILRYSPKQIVKAPEQCSLRSVVWILAFVLLVVLLFLWYQGFSLQNVFLRGGDEDLARNDDNKMVGLIFGKSLRYVPMSVATVYWMYGKSRPAKLLLLATGVFCCFPLGMARLQIAPAYLPLLIVMFKSLYRHRMLLVSMFVGAILFLFPFLHGFRQKEVDLLEFCFFDFSFLNQMHFDSYASFAYLLKERFITGGEQLLGALLFWVPRSLWANKPIESGRMIAETFDLGVGDFTNIAVNYFAEGYLNFGFSGVLLFTMVMAYICARMDRVFWSDTENLARPIALYYFSWLGFLVFLLRGDLMAGFSYTIGIMIAHKMSLVAAMRSGE